MKIILKLTLVVLALQWIASCSKKSPSEPETPDFPYGYDRQFDYLSVLKASPEYAYESTDGLPTFTYQDSSNENLTDLRNQYQLEAVAGDGEEWSKIVNLLKWVHETLRHDGSSSSPDPETSLNILSYCQESGNGVNCVMLAIVLNETYLSMGFKSRVIHGNPRHYVYNGEWHAFNMVYSETFGKWVYVDPTTQGYYTNDDGIVLSVAEIRDHLRRDIPLHLCDDADYNGRPMSQMDNLHYLSKNFYRFTCVVNSAFGGNWIFHENSDVNRTFIYLNPANESTNGLDDALNYNTSNPDYFWSEP